MNSLEAEVERLRQEVEQLHKERKQLAEALRRAKDPSPVQRVSFRRVLELVSNACMVIERVRGGWLLRLGSMQRRFRFLKQIWELLILDDWLITEIFPPQAEPQERSRPRLPQRHPAIAPPVLKKGAINYG